MKDMKCCVCSIMIHLVEADGKGEWWHQMNSHEFSGASSTYSKETHLLKGEETPGAVLLGALYQSSPPHSH